MKGKNWRKIKKGLQSGELDTLFNILKIFNSLFLSRNNFVVESTQLTKIEVKNVLKIP